MDYESSYRANHTLGMCLGCQEHRELIIWGMNGGVVACLGLILWQNGATGSREVLRYLPGLQNIKIRPKSTKKQKFEKSENLRIFIYFLYSLPIYRLGGLYVLKEFAETHVIPARVEGGSEQQPMTPDLLAPAARRACSKLVFRLSGNYF